MKTLLIDNYDSFSHILHHCLWEVNGEMPLLIKNDAWTLERIRAARFDNIVISPGPGRPDCPGDFGVCAQVIAAFPEVPMLGVCLGLQGMGWWAGARIVQAPTVRHGKYSRILHQGAGLFAGLPPGFRAVRYHSLVIDGESCPPGVEITATAEDDGQIMGVRLRDRPGYGVQFHPESIGAEAGKALLANFRDLSEEWLRAQGRSRSRGRPTRSIPVTPGKPGPATAPARDPEVVELPWMDPETAFARCFRNLPAAFWLDSQAVPSGGGARAGGSLVSGFPDGKPEEPRMSYMGAGKVLIEARGDTVSVLEIEAGGTEFRLRESRRADPFDFLAAWPALWEPWKLPEGCAFRGSFRGGLIGYFGYELKAFTGGRNRADTPPSSMPDALFLQPDRLLAFDHGAGKVFAFLSASDAHPEARAFREALAELSNPGFAPSPDLDLERIGPDPSGMEDFRLPWRASATREEYLGSILALQDALRRGDSYEACLTQEIKSPSRADPFEVYRILRRTNPAPYAAYLRFPHGSVLSASPERFLKLDGGGNLSCRPIKGTRRKGDTPAESLALRADLAGNAKDHSENLMIVDLVRDDFAKVCAPGSVRVPEMMVVEEHPTVWQLVSAVQGRLAEGFSSLDAVRACFPGGSMTGAPKLRTMELLEAREGKPRGVFSGALGYLGSGGALDLGIVIRTFIYRDGMYSVGCGGAILWESDPEGEYREALLKSFALLRAVELAEFGACGGWRSKPAGK